jgi:hypothetical protein
MNPTSDDIKDMLEADSSLGLSLGTNLFIGREPSSPRNCATIFDSGGFPPGMNLSGNENYYRPSIQIRVRNMSYQIAWQLAYDILNSLHGRAQETWNGTLYTVIRAIDDPAFLDWDENDNCRFVVNFNIQRR